MGVYMDGDINNIKTQMEEALSIYNSKTRTIRIYYDENRENKSEFSLELVKLYMEEIKRLYPNNSYDIYVSYTMKEKFILDTDNCKQLEEIDNYLRSNYGFQLLINAKDELLPNGFRSIIQANRKIDVIANKIKNATYNGSPLSPFEKFMLIYNEVTNHPYNSGNKIFHVDSNHWVPVMNGDKIVCTGYASLLKAICERVFDNNEVIVYENHMDVYDKKTSEKLGGHANNIVFIKDNKYDINGMFYTDACWDATGDKKDKTHAYCCIPIIDILNDKANAFEFSNIVPSDIEDTYEKFFFPNKKKVEGFFMKIKFFKKINDFFKLLEYKERVTLKHFIDNYDSSPNKSIVPLEAFTNAFKILGAQKGLNGKELDDYVESKIDLNIRATKFLFDNEKCHSCFATSSNEKENKLKISNKR